MSRIKFVLERSVYTLQSDRSPNIMDKLIDELVKGKKMGKILRSQRETIRNVRDQDLTFL